jgi:hypothetical protein
MRSVLNLLCLLGIVFSLALCSFSVSTKEKPTYNKCDIVGIDVSRETIDLEPLDLNKSPGFKYEAIIADVIFIPKITDFNDPFLSRSQRWIKENNLRATLRRTETNKSYLTQKLNT